MAPFQRSWPARLHDDELLETSIREVAVIVRDLTEVVGTDRDVEAPTFSSRRMLLAKDGMGFSLHDTILFAGTETKIHYRNHLEAVYCIEGSAEIVELDGDGAVHEINPGVMYALDGHERHLLRAITDFRALCVFNPPLTGREVHDEDGVYPLMTEDQ